MFQNFNSMKKQKKVIMVVDGLIFRYKTLFAFKYLNQTNQELCRRYRSNVKHRVIFSYIFLKSKSQCWLVCFPEIAERGTQDFSTRLIKHTELGEKARRRRSRRQDSGESIKAWTQVQKRFWPNIRKCHVINRDKTRLKSNSVMLMLSY